MGKKSTPAPPDYEAAAEREAEGSRQVVEAQSWANRPDQFTPWGSTSWENRSVYDPSTNQNINRWTQTQNLTPALQSALDSQVQVQLGRSQMAEGLIQNSANTLNEAMPWDQMPDPGRNVNLPDFYGQNLNQWGQGGQAMTGASMPDSSSGRNGYSDYLRNIADNQYSNGNWGNFAPGRGGNIRIDTSAPNRGVGPNGWEDVQAARGQAANPDIGYLNQFGINPNAILQGLREYGQGGNAMLGDLGMFGQGGDPRLRGMLNFGNEGDFRLSGLNQFQGGGSAQMGDLGRKGSGVDGNMGNIGPGGRQVDSQMGNIGPGGRGVNSNMGNIGQTGRGVNSNMGNIGPGGSGVNSNMGYLGQTGSGVNSNMGYLGQTGRGVNSNMGYLGQTGSCQQPHGGHRSGR
jgi:hypothetical protein